MDNEIKYFTEHGLSLLLLMLCCSNIRHGFKNDSKNSAVWDVVIFHRRYPVRGLGGAFASLKFERNDK